MSAPKKKDLLALSSIPLIMTLGNSMLIPVLPGMRSQLNVSSFQVSLIITVYSVVAIFLIPVAGFLSDRFGRKKVIVPSLILTGLGGLLCGIAAVWLAHAYVWILAGRFIQGIGAAGAFPIVMPLVGDLFQDEAQVSAGLGMIETSNTFGKVLSPILGSLLAVIVWHAPFWAIPVLCAASLIMVWLMVKVPKKQEAKPPGIPQFFASVRTLFRQKGRWLYAIFVLGGICMFVVFGTLFYLSQMLEDEHGMHGVLKGGMLAIPTAALCACSFGTGKLIGNHKKRMKWFNLSGTFLLTAATLVCAWFGEKSVLLDMVLISLSSAGVGIALPCLDAFITEGIEKEQRGTVTSFYSSMRFIGVAAGPPVASVMLKPSAGPFFYLAAGLGGVAILLSAFALKPKED
ncbi:MFS transporter [Paenibacillus sp. YN15]|uniref:MFS transporter n=1 Tax=Paenibacillus sp. YN15 TaxID=1742774 RepID=UPI000DCC0B48|nr:MFS transporter [Paenibacillus sp. YN15]RAU98885.1 MFS transporter [Paenibacillus sp. YN15]